MNWEAKVRTKGLGTEDVGMNIKGSEAGEMETRTQDSGAGPGSLWLEIKDCSIKSWKAKGLGQGIDG